MSAGDYKPRHSAANRPLYTYDENGLLVEDERPEEERFDENGLFRYEEDGPAGTSKRRRRGRGILDFIIVVAVALVLTFLVRNFVMAPYEIPSESMRETIQVGDRVFSERITLYRDAIEAGDIVTFTDPTNSQVTLIKRVIATGGQTVDLIDGSVYVDGMRLDEPYTAGKPSDPLYAQAPGVEVSFPYTVPEGYLWVMGDNRTNSSDSRYFGAIPEDSVTGHAFVIYWPFSRFGLLH